MKGVNQKKRYEGDFGREGRGPLQRPVTRRYLSDVGRLEWTSSTSTARRRFAEHLGDGNQPDLVTFLNLVGLRCPQIIGQAWKRKCVPRSTSVIALPKSTVGVL